MTEQEMREKVINALEYCSVSGDNRDCDSCPIGFGEGCALKLKRAALVLLKAQEPVKPIIDTYWETPSVYDNDVKVTENKCGACGAEIDKWDKYCRVCGRKVKWE